METEFETKHTLLVMNAVDFIMNSINNFKENNYKYAIINFYNGLELFFKARLFVEHWTLILHKTDDANKIKFLNGDIKTVSLSDALKRLKNVSSENFGKLEELITDLNIIRNNLVHFTNPEIFNSNAQKEYSSIVCKAWYYFFQKLKSDWIDYFPKFEYIFKKLENTLHEFQGFLQVKYEDIKPELNEMEKEGLIISDCGACGKPTVIEEKSTHKNSYYHSWQCLVCNDVTDVLIVHCPNCNTPCSFSSWEITYCECGYSIKLEDVIQFYTSEFTKNLNIKEKKEYNFPIYCKKCYTKGPTVFLIDDKLTCVNCNDRIEMNNQYTCINCSSNFAGPADLSLLFGCPNCLSKYGKQNSSEK